MTRIGTHGVVGTIAVAAAVISCGQAETPQADAFRTWTDSTGKYTTEGAMIEFSESGGQVGLATCSPEGLELRGTFSVDGQDKSWAHPVVIGGRLYLRCEDNLYCFDVRA